MALPFHPKGSLEEALANLGKKMGATPPAAPAPSAPPVAAPPTVVAPAPADDVSVAALTAAATARVPAVDAHEARTSGAAYFRQDVGRSVGSALPVAARAASGQRLEHLRIHEADLHPIGRTTPAALWRSIIRKSYEARPPKGFAMRAVAHYVNAVLYVEKVLDKGLGYARRAFEELGALSGFGSLTRYSGRHMKRVARDLEARGLIDVLNTLKRDGDMWVRGANVYVPVVDEEMPPLPADVDAPDPPELARASSGVAGAARLSALFGLALRPWGLNTSPLRSPRNNPAPA